MPRSDRIYVFIVVAFAAVLVLVSIVATIRTLTGKPEERPGYDRAPVKELVKPNPTSGSIAKVENAERPPIDDQTFLVLHKSTRVMAQKLARGEGYAALARKWAMPTDALMALVEKRRSMSPSMTGLLPGKGNPVSVYRPTLPKDRRQADLQARTVTSVSFRPRSLSGGGGTMRTEMFWEQRSNVWSLQEVQLDWSVSGGGEAVPTNPAESGEVSDLPTPE